jgi:uncharacterized phage protein (TIGR02218 family)
LKQVSSPLKELIEGGRFIQGAGAPGSFIPFDLYTVITTGGIVLNYTTADFPISAPNNTIFDAPKIDGGGNIWTAPMTWSPAPIDMSDTKSTAHWKIGLDSDTWTVKFAPKPQGQAGVTPDMIGAQPWLAAAAAGALDNADCIVSRAYFAAMPTWPMPAGGAVPVGTMALFRGYLGEVDLTTTSAILTVNDYRQLLQQMMPRNLYLAGCRHRFGDSRCTVNLAAYTHIGTAGSSSTRGRIAATSSVAAPGGSNSYELGVLTMTSGLNNGFSRMIVAWDSGPTFALLNPFPYNVATGDTFSVSAGCHKTMSDYTAFSNLINFRGYPFIPIPEVSLS